MSDPLVLGAAFTIENASDLQRLLLAELPGCDRVCLSAVSEIDGAGLQLLLASKAQYPDLKLCNPSNAIRQVFAMLNLSHLLSA